jgi:hypothetical protein
MVAVLKPVMVGCWERVGRPQTSFLSPLLLVQRFVAFSLYCLCCLLCWVGGVCGLYTVGSTWKVEVFA